MNPNCNHFDCKNECAHNFDASKSKTKSIRKRKQFSLINLIYWRHTSSKFSGHLFSTAGKQRNSSHVSRTVRSSRLCFWFSMECFYHSLYAVCFHRLRFCMHIFLGLKWLISDQCANSAHTFHLDAIYKHCIIGNVDTPMLINQTETRHRVTFHCFRILFRLPCIIRVSANTKLVHWYLT